jgi:hypothetical protein
MRILKERMAFIEYVLPFVVIVIIYVIWLILSQRQKMSDKFVNLKKKLVIAEKTQYGKKRKQRVT